MRYSGCIWIFLSYRWNGFRGPYGHKCKCDFQSVVHWFQKVALWNIIQEGLNYRKIQSKQKKDEVSILTPVLPDYAYSWQGCRQCSQQDVIKTVSIIITGCASASPVLTATGFVNGRWQFSTPHRINTLDRSPKKLVQVIMSSAPTATPNLV